MKKTGKTDAFAEAAARSKADAPAKVHSDSKTYVPTKIHVRSKTNRTILVGDRYITVIRSNRKNMALEVTPTAKVIVRTPARTSMFEVARFVKEKENWIRKTVAEQKRKLEDASKQEPLTDEEMQKLGDLALKVLPVRVKLYAAQMGVTYGRITIRCQKTRWGSCSSAGNLNFNCLLMLAPEEVQNYVVVHELCHRLEMNHSKRFWEQVEKVMPDYKVHQKWLKENGSRLMARRP